MYIPSSDATGVCRHDHSALIGCFRDNEFRRLTAFDTRGLDRFVVHRAVDLEDMIVRTLVVVAHFYPVTVKSALIGSAVGGAVVQSAEAPGFPEASKVVRGFEAGWAKVASAADSA